MKILLFLAALLCISSISYGQFSRSFYLSSYNQTRKNALVKHNSEIKLLSIRESANDTLRVTVVTIDDDGETTNYSNFSLSPFNLEPQFAISGAGVNSLGNPVICMNQQMGGEMKTQYITLDFATNSISSVTELPSLYRRAGIQTRVNGDSLISYFGTINGSTKIDRISTSMTNTANFSTELVTNTLTHGASSFSSPSRRLDLLIDNTDEYIHFSTYVIKRTAPGSYLVATTTNSTIGSPVLIKNNSNEIVALTGNVATVYDNNFIEQSVNVIPIPSIDFTTKIEAYASPSGYRIWTTSGSSSSIAKYFELDNSFIEIQRGINDYFNPISRKEIDGKHYILGFTTQNAQTTSLEGVQNISAQLSSIICDNLSSAPKDFIEYNQRLQNGNIEFFVNHVGRSYSQNHYASSGFNYNLSNSYRGLGYASSQYTIGKSLSGDLEGFFMNYGSNGSFVPGPYTSAGSYSHLIEDKYNRGYYVSKEMIEAHITAIGNNDPNYVIPFGIKYWPTNGDITKGQAENLAAYVDRNGNGSYDPENGDYPSIYGDQCLLNIYHQHPLMLESNSIETHQYYFTFDCTIGDELENTVFIRQDEFLREHDLIDAYHGTFMDLDIGRPFDDYCGTNVELGMIYGYNGDSVDEPTPGIAVFNDTLPYFGIMALKGVKLPESGADRPFGVGPNESINGLGFGDGIPGNEYYTIESSITITSISPGAINPNDLSSAYSVMQGNYGNGTQQYSGSIPIRHSYFDNSDPLFYTSGGLNHGNNYSELTENNTVGDRRMYCASGPTDFYMGDTMVLINAYIVGIDTVNISSDSSRVLLFNYGQSIREMYALNSTPCGGDFGTYVSDNDASLDELVEGQIFVYPNPTNSSFQFKGIAGNSELEIVDLNGRIVLSQHNITDEITVHIPHLVNSIYFLQIKDENGTHVLRLLKN